LLAANLRPVGLSLPKPPLRGESFGIPL
jgi:hypothetical protein